MYRKGPPRTPQPQRAARAMAGRVCPSALLSAHAEAPSGTPQVCAHGGSARTAECPGFAAPCCSKGLSLVIQSGEDSAGERGQAGQQAGRGVDDMGSLAGSPLGRERHTGVGPGAPFLRSPGRPWAPGDTRYGLVKRACVNKGTCCVVSE